MSKGTYSFTTPIYYVNAEPHLGTAYTTVAADTVARYQRMNGYDVAFVTGMDEHGQKVADTAESKGMTPQAWCDSMEPAFRNVWDLLDITYTDFVRTTQPRHARTVQKFWQDLFDKGWCYKGSYEGWYCVHEETYYAESDLEKNEDGELVCPDCHRPVQKAGGEENWFFKLSEFQEPLLKFYEENPDFIRPETRKNEVVTFVKSGLKDLSISRSTFDWGVPLLFDEGAAVVHTAVVVHARHGERRQGLEAHAELGLVGLDLIKQRFEVLLALGGAPDPVFDDSELLSNPIDYLADVVVPALNLVSRRLARLGGLLEVIVMKGCIGSGDVQGVFDLRLLIAGDHGGDRFQLGVDALEAVADFGHVRLADNHRCRGKADAGDLRGADPGGFE